MDSEEYVNKIYRKMIREYRRVEKEEAALLLQKQQPSPIIVKAMVEEVKVGRTRKGSIGKLLPRRLSKNMLELFNQPTK